MVTLDDPTADDGHRQLWIHHPAGPDAVGIPVLYLLHGLPGNPRSLIGDLAPKLDREMCRTGLPFVVAVPDGQAGDLDTEWGDDAAGRFDLESFVTGPVIDATEGGARRAADLRAIGGVSMGGYGATVLALRHPDLYAQVASFGGYYHPDDRDGVFAADAAAHAPDQIVSAANDKQRFFLAEGEREYTPLQDGSIRGEADRFAAILTQRSVTVSVVHPPGGHDDSTWDPAIPPCVDFLGAGWRAGQ